MSDLIAGLAHCIPLSTTDLETIARTASYRYKVYTLPKRNGRGTRTIAQPAPEVKWIQAVIVDKFLSDWPIHEAATAYRKNASIAVHAARHAQSRFLLKLDFQDFFPSITAADIGKHIATNTQLSEPDQHLLVSILTWLDKKNGRRCLSIGAPSSPFVSNSMVFELDVKIQEYCRAHGATYSRYADDLAFSSDREWALEDIRRYVEDTLKELTYPRLRLNEAKTVNVSRRHHRSLVGLVLTPEGGVSIGREKKRLLRAQLDHYVKGNLDSESVANLRGMLAYVLSVEPEFVGRMVHHHGAEAIESLGISAAALRRHLK